MHIGVKIWVDECPGGTDNGDGKDRSKVSLDAF